MLANNSSQGIPRLLSALSIKIITYVKPIFISADLGLNRYLLPPRLSVRATYYFPIEELRQALEIFLMSTSAQGHQLLGKIQRVK